MKNFKNCLSVAGLLVFLSCSMMPHTKTGDSTTGILAISGVVQERVTGDLLVSVRMPEITAPPSSPIGEMAQQVIKKSIVVEGMETTVNGMPAIIREVRGPLVRIALEQEQALKPGDTIRMAVPKKTMAVIDFDVIQGGRKEVGKVVLEDLTTALIDSGQFIVLERSKLKAIMNEIELSMSGLARETPDTYQGRLFVADLILTGTLSETGGEWDINLRLINVRTGHALSAIHMKTSLFKPSEMRDAGRWMEDFEGSAADPAWMFSYRRRNTGEYVRTTLDRNAGVDNSKQSLRIDFSFDENNEPFFAHIQNNKRRNLALFSGVEFSVKGTEDLYGYVSIATSSPDNPNKIDKWAGLFEIRKEWEKIRIPFDRMVLARHWIKQGAVRFGAVPGDQILRLNRVEHVEFGVDNMRNPPTKGSVWIDGIYFYRD